jgi:hypothetical protein
MRLLIALLIMLSLTGKAQLPSPTWEKNYVCFSVMSSADVSSISHYMAVNIQLKSTLGTVTMSLKSSGRSVFFSLSRIGHSSDGDKEMTSYAAMYGTTPFKINFFSVGHQLHHIALVTESYIYLLFIHYPTGKFL